jgi:hypothetical protein
MGYPSTLGGVTNLKSTVENGEHVQHVNVDNVEVTLDPTNLATGAKQDIGNTSLASILAKIIAAPATEAKQDTGNTSLAAINNNTKPLAITSNLQVAFDDSVQSAAIVGTKVRLVSTQPCHVAFGANPTAVADGSCFYLPAGVVEIVTVATGEKIAAIKEGETAGKLFITVLS